MSTVAAFVVAGAGVPVAKHGNRAASSRAGSADVLEALGVVPDLPVAAAAAMLKEVGIAFFFARRAHPAMRHVAAVRQELGVRTLMNCLGPLLNPVGARRQLVGVYEADLVVPLARGPRAARRGAGARRPRRRRARRAHDDDDEHDRVVRRPAGGQRGASTRPSSGFRAREPEALRGGDARRNAEIARAVLGGEQGARRDIVC